MIEVKTKRLCNFCNEVVREDDTYNHGDCIINLSFTRCYTYDYYSQESKTEGIDICSNCLAEIRRCLSLSSNEKVKKLFRWGGFLIPKDLDFVKTQSLIQGLALGSATSLLCFECYSKLQDKYKDYLKKCK